MPDCSNTPPVGTDVRVEQPLVAATPAGRRPPTARALAKQGTRAKLLKAARQLFTEQGYEGATIRDIAAAAGMSTGAVFANFTEKFDLFREIAAEDMARLVQAMREASTSGKTVDEALLAIFSAGYDFYLEQLPMVQAKMAVGWSEAEGRELRRVMPREAFLEIIGDALAAGVQRRELAGEVEASLRGRMLFELYLGNFRHAVFDEWDMAKIRKRMADQIRIVLAGVRAAELA